MPSSLLGALWVVPALPLLGFLLNGALALWRPHAKKIGRASCRERV